MDSLEQQFEEEKLLGMMEEVDEAEFRSRYPKDRVLVAAQGALEKSDNSFRVIHDGTHGVSINPNVIPRDQTRMPGSSDLRSAMAEDATHGGAFFSLQADIKKAHRRVLIQKSDWGLQCCRLRPENPTL